MSARYLLERRPGGHTSRHPSPESVQAALAHDLELYRQGQTPVRHVTVKASTGERGPWRFVERVDLADRARP